MTFSEEEFMRNWCIPIEEEEDRLFKEKAERLHSQFVRHNKILTLSHTGSRIYKARRKARRA